MRPLIRAVKASPRLEPYLVVTGAHLVRASGETKRMIAADDFRIDATLPIMGDNGTDTGRAMAESFGRAALGLSRILVRAKPNMVIAI